MYIDGYRYVYINKYICKTQGDVQTQRFSLPIFGFLAPGAAETAEEWPDHQEERSGAAVYIYIHIILKIVIIVIITIVYVLNSIFIIYCMNIV